MNRVAIAFSTADRVELSRQSIEPLLSAAGGFDLHWIDGSKTTEGKELPRQYDGQYHMLHTDVRGGSGPAIVYALTMMLAAKPFAPPLGTVGSQQSHREWQRGYDHIGLVENDVVLPHDWFDKTMLLFSQGEEAGLEVGAVSARCYEDRILVQKDGWAACHNLGAGMIVFTREAAELVLNQYRVQWTSENRRTFAMLTDQDVGKYWAFRGQEHFLVADWRWDSLLAQHGFASLALSPSSVQMIGQVPPLEQQGLEISTGGWGPYPPMEENKLFETYQHRLYAVRKGICKLPNTLFHRDQQGYTIFAHQIGGVGGSYQGNWKLKDAPGFGPFGWIADSHQEDWDPRINIPIAGSCEILVSGGKEGGQVEIVDEQTGFNARPILPAEGGAGTIVSVNLPGNVAYRTIRINMSTPGCVFYGVRTRDEQPRVSNWKFDWNTLPHGRTEL